MRRMALIVRIGLFLAAGAVSIAAPDAGVPEPKGGFEPRFYVCFRSPKPVAIDGQLNDPGWKKAEWTESFVDIEGGRKPEPRLRTRVKMLWDDNWFYIAAELEEPSVWASAEERDSLVYEDNDFEVFIDPDADTHRYCELEINAANAVRDVFLIKPYRDGGPALAAWDIRGMKTAVVVDGTLNDPGKKDKGWTVEIAVPWAALRECGDGFKERPDPGDQWRINFSRLEYRLSVRDGAYVKAVDPSSGRPLAEDNWTWSPQGLINIHYPEMWGFVQFTGRTAGKGRELFADSFDEKVKWALRRIYYRELEYRRQNGVFTPDFEALGFGKDPALTPDGWGGFPRIAVTDGLFEASYGNGEGVSWHIRQDGLVWMKEAK